MALDAERLGWQAGLEGATRHNNPFHILREAKKHEAWERGRITSPDRSPKGEKPQALSSREPE